MDCCVYLLQNLYTVCKKSIQVCSFIADCFCVIPWIIQSFYTSNRFIWFKKLHNKKNTRYIHMMFAVYRIILQGVFDLKGLFKHLKKYRKERQTTSLPDISDRIGSCLYRPISGFTTTTIYWQKRDFTQKHACCCRYNLCQSKRYTISTGQ